MIIVKQKEYSGVGTKFIHFKNKLKNPGMKDNVALKRQTIAAKQSAEKRLVSTSAKVGRAVGERGVTAALLAGPMLPVPVVSQVVGATYAVSPKTVEKIPGVGKALTGIRNSKAMQKVANKTETAGKKVGEGLSKKLFKVGKKIAKKAR